MSLEMLLFAGLVGLVGWRKAICTVVTGYAFGIVICAGIIMLLLLLSMCVGAVR